MGKFWGRLEVGWGKSGVLEHKSDNISKTRKLEEKLLWTAYRKSPTLFPMSPFPTPYGLLIPKIGVHNPHPKTPIAIFSGTGKATDFKFGWHRIHPNKSPLKFFDKRERGRIQGLPKVFRYYRRNG